MHYQPKVLPQSKSTFFKDGWSMRKPVEGTVARGFMPYEFKGMPDSLVVATPNPLPVTQKVLDLGKKRFDTYWLSLPRLLRKGRQQAERTIPGSAITAYCKGH